MAATYTLISSNVLTSSAGSVTFSSIPSTYKDLVLRFGARRNSDAAFIRFNGLSTTSYSYLDIEGLGTVTNSSTNNYSYFIIYGGANNNSSDSANTFSNVEVYIPNYAGSVRKSYTCYMVRENNTTTSAGNMLGINGGFFDSSAAISSLSITAFNGGTFDAGSSFYLYGIKNT